MSDPEDRNICGSNSGYFDWFWLVSLTLISIGLLKTMCVPSSVYPAGVRLSKRR